MYTGHEIEVPGSGEFVDVSDIVKGWRAFFLKVSVTGRGVGGEGSHATQDHHASQDHHTSQDHHADQLGECGPYPWAAEEWPALFGQGAGAAGGEPRTDLGIHTLGAGLGS